MEPQNGAWKDLVATFQEVFGCSPWNLSDEPKSINLRFMRVFFRNSIPLTFREMFLASSTKSKPRNEKLWDESTVASNPSAAVGTFEITWHDIPSVGSSYHEKSW